VDKVSQKTTTPPGEIERLSISALLNDKTEFRDGKPVPVPRSPEELARLEELIKRTVGFNLERGDSLKVDSAPFIRAEAVDNATAPIIPAWRRYLPYILVGAALLAIAVVTLVWRKKYARSNMALLPVRRSVGLDGTVGELQRGEQGAAGALTGGPSTAQLTGSQYIDAPIRRARALQMANEDPATAAIVIRKWLNAAAAPAASARL
jgi:flagellar M-ring protein FliF